MESRKTKGVEFDFGGPRWFVFNTHWRLTLLSVQRQWSRGTGGRKLLLRDTLQHTSSFVKRFVYSAGIYHYISNVPSQTKILLLWLQIPVILDLIEFEIFTWRLLKLIAFPGFWISTFSGRACNLPQETPRGSRLWRSQYFPLLRNNRISTNTPSETTATRLST